VPLAVVVVAPPVAVVVEVVVEAPPVPLVVEAPPVPLVVVVVAPPVPLVVVAPPVPLVVKAPPVPLVVEVVVVAPPVPPLPLVEVVDEVVAVLVVDVVIPPAPAVPDPFSTVGPQLVAATARSVVVTRCVRRMPIAFCKEVAIRSPLEPALFPATSVRSCDRSSIGRSRPPPDRPALEALTARSGRRTRPDRPS
jgi:hypothetical protein